MIIGRLCAVPMFHLQTITDVDTFPNEKYCICVWYIDRSTPTDRHNKKLVSIPAEILTTFRRTMEMNKRASRLLAAPFRWLMDENQQIFSFSTWMILNGNFDMCIYNILYVCCINDIDTFVRISFCARFKLKLVYVSRVYTCVCGEDLGDSSMFVSCSLRMKYCVLHSYMAYQICIKISPKTHQIYM